MVGGSPKKSLGQHWLGDKAVLSKITSYADLTDTDTVLEIGPGPGTLTKIIQSEAGKVIAVEFDAELAEALPKNEKLQVINADFLQFDLSQLPIGYKVVANIPYYITNPIVEKLITSSNKPEIAVLLVQKEVAERLAAGPGEMSVLSVMAQFYADVSTGIVVPPELFTPPPKVDSQVVILKPKKDLPSVDEKLFFRIVKAGFSERRKKLRSSLAGGLHISKPEAENMLNSAGINPNLRAQDLTINDWCAILSVSQ